MEQKPPNVHPDVLFLESDEIGLVISKGLAAVVTAKPPNPVEYLAKWLLAYDSQSGVRQMFIERALKAETAKAKYQEKQIKENEMV